MKRSLTLILAAATIGLTVPAIASAQPWYHRDDRALAELTQRENILATRIDRAETGHRLTHREAGSLRTQLSVIRRDQLRHRASGHGMTDRERRDINLKLDRLSARVHDQAN